MSGWLELTGAANVRDVGGLRAGERRVRSGLLLRSDHLDDATDEDFELLVRTLGLRGVVDLRTEAEEPTPPSWSEHGVRGLALSLFDLSGTTDYSRFRGSPADSYEAMLELAGDSLVTILRFAVEDAPVLVHCAAGKDRTGIVVAVLLALAGVDEADIVADYLATGERLGRVRDNLSRKTAYQAMATNPMLSQGMTAEPIERVLAMVAAHEGGVAGFLLAHGATAADIARWREQALVG